MRARSDQVLLLVIFGITGDLAQRKLLPALYRLTKNKDLPKTTRIIGISRGSVLPSSVYAQLDKYLAKEEYDPEVKEHLKKQTEMVKMDLLDHQAYQNLLTRLKAIEEEIKQSTVRLYYLSIPPQVFVPIIKLLGQTKHNSPITDLDSQPRLLVEKPFGYDSASAKELIDVVDSCFNENQIYRIDHYVAKETVQNILTFHFQNPLFEAVWDNKHISSISVVAHESIGIEGRVTFYEQTGALRDLIQSHLLQLLAATTMTKPSKMASTEIHIEKLKLLRAIKPIAANQVKDKAFRGQYIGYLKEVSKPSSYVETFARVCLDIDNQRWSGVPITLETGKALAKKMTEIVICFFSGHEESSPTNRLTFRIQPDEGITLLLQVKRPGVDTKVEAARMKFDYRSEFSERQTEAYERVLIDAMSGDQTLFATSAEVLASWQIIENVIAEWAKDGSGLVTYKKGAESV